MAIRTLTGKKAAELDQKLMGSCQWSIDQLMELAGLAVSQAVFKTYPPKSKNRVLVACGSGNNGGDGLVAARHLRHYGYQPTVYYPSHPAKTTGPAGEKNPIYQRLVKQIQELGDVKIIDNSQPFPDLSGFDQVVDAIFGFSFDSSRQLREPWDKAIRDLATTTLPVTSVDVPSSWDVETGPPASEPGNKFFPDVLISLTAPKPLVDHLHRASDKKILHFVGGRFVSPAIAQEFDIDIPEYEGLDQVAEVPVKAGAEGQKL